jgi:plastocyanin domain-containing protein
MQIDKLIITIFNALAVGFIYWFFFMKREKHMQALHTVDILVNGGYSPASIVVNKGRVIKLNFLLTDTSSCLEEVVLDAFKIRKYLPLHKKVTIEIKPQVAGEFPFSCGMNMYHGKIIVK